MPTRRIRHQAGLAVLAAALGLCPGLACVGQSAPAVESGSAACGDPFAGTADLAFDPAGWATDFCRHSVSYEEIFSGGPPRDGIPPLDAPRFVSVASANAWLNPEEPVLLLRTGEEARAYPLQILIWHEIVNDRVRGTPVVVTFCPLCYAALAFERPVVDGDTLTFGTTGNLRHSDLIMWDRQTESWWQQFTGEAVVGRLTGTQLTMLPTALISWAQFKQTHPGGLVLSRETGFARAYGDNPYVGYDDVEQSPFLYRGPVGDRLPPMARVVGVMLNERGRAYPLDVLRTQSVVNDTLAGVPLAVFWREGAASAVDGKRIAGSRDIGMTGVFAREAAGRVLHFTPGEAQSFRDEETGSAWNVLGEAVSGPLKGETLRPLVHHDIFWFVWSAFQPEGELYTPDS